MLRNQTRLAILPALLLTATLWGCDGTSRVLAPSDVRMDVGTSSGGYTLVRERNPTVGIATAVIGPSGGRLVLGAHTLDVPAGAVSAPTTFVMSKTDRDLRVSLSATQKVLDDVGSKGFDRPVTLTLSYQGASTPPLDESALRIVWLRPDGTQEVEASTTDVQGKKVSAELWHFSDYGLGDPGRSGGGTTAN